MKDFYLLGKEVMFSFVGLSVCRYVSSITQNIVNRLQ